MPLDPITGGEDLASSVLSTVTNVFDRLVPDKNEAAKEAAALQVQIMAMVAAENTGQVEVNKVEAGSSNLFVSGWRPAVGWVCAAGFAYAFFLGPIAAMCIKVWKSEYVLPVLDTSALTTMLLGMLGLGGMRTYEKQQGIEPPTNPIITTKTVTGKVVASRRLPL